MNTWSEHRVLNHLIETCRDGERGFRLASQQVADPGLKALFTELSAQRATFAAQLVPHVQRLGGQPASDGTATASLHRRWMVLEQAFRQGDHATVTEVERGDKVTLRIYLDALEGMLPPDTRELVQKQCDEIEEGHARIPVRASLV
jgi:uncharacterized protein (TIGR02284 family)